MKLKKISIHGFRSIREQTWEPGALNVLIGPNNAGKSNFLRALELLKDAITGDLDRAIVRLGGIRALLWNGESPELKWHVEVEPGESLGKDRRKSEALEYELSIIPLGISSNFRVERETFKNSTSSREKSGFKYFERDAHEAIIFEPTGKVSTRLSEQLDGTQTLMSQSSLLFPIGNAFYFYSYVKMWGIHHDLLIHQGAPVRHSAITRNETWLFSNGQNLATVLHTLYTTDKAFRNYVIDAMRAAFGREFDEIEFAPAEDQRIQMRVRWSSLKNSYSAGDLPDGLLRFLMLLAIFGNPSTGRLIAIDEPEVFLHPRMLPIIAELAVEASERNQIILTTHSPQLLTAIGSKQPTTTVVENVRGETQLSMLNNQELKRWLENYSLGELYLAGDLEALK